MADAVPTETLTMNYEKIEWTYSKSESAGDSSDFQTEKDDDETAGLLLPAVQQVCEGSTLPPDEDDPAMERFEFEPAEDDGETAYEYKLDGIMISSYDVNGSADSDRDRWIDVLSTDWGTSKPGADANVPSDGNLVAATVDTDMSGDFIL